MKITTYLTDCKRKVAEQSSLLNNIGSEENAYLCFRLRDKNLDLKVRTDILVMSELWDNDIPGYGKSIDLLLLTRRRSILLPLTSSPSYQMSTMPKRLMQFGYEK